VFGPPWVGDTDPLAKLPKVSLHDHLDGSVRPATLIEIAAEQGTDDVLVSDDPAAVERWLRGDSEEGRPFGHEELFALLCSVMQTPETLQRVASEYVATAAADGVVYAESRWAPEKHQVRGMSLDDAVLAVAAGLEDGTATAATAGHEIVVRQLLCGMRNTARSAEIAELAVRHRDTGVVGFDIAGAEAGLPPTPPHAAVA
jgi:adenosine deaminase